MFTRENGWRIKPMVRVSILMRMVQNTMANGRMTSSMEQARNHGQMVLYMRVNTTRARRMGVVN